MQQKHKDEIIRAIESGNYRFVKDKLGNNYLAILPGQSHTIELLHLRTSISFPGQTHGVAFDYMMRPEFEEKIPVWS